MTRSESLHARASTMLPGGVNSPVRAFRAVGGTPVYFERAAGAHVWGADGERYIDYIGSWGPAIVGHAHPDVVAAVAAAAARGLSFGAPCAAEADLAARVIEQVPSVEKLRLVSSGTEACLSAIRLARGATGRAAILKFEGCYHGHGDSFLVKAGSGALTLGTPDSAGVPAALAALTLTAPYNDIAAVEALFAAHGHDIAAVIVEPVAGNMNLILPQPGFLEGLRQLCDQHGAVLIFDEVMTGFRVALGGAQQRFAIRPDLTCFGKVIGGGMPVGAYGGKRELMDLVAPLGPVYQAGTLSGNPVAMAAGITTLELIARPGFYAELEAKAQALMDGLATAASEAQISFATAVAGGMFGFFFTSGPVMSYAQARAADLSLFKHFFHAMLRRGVYLAPSAFEAGFISIAHDDADITATVDAARMSLAEIASSA